MSYTNIVSPKIGGATFASYRLKQEANGTLSKQLPDSTSKMN